MKHKLMHIQEPVDGEDEGDIFRRKFDRRQSDQHRHETGFRNACRTDGRSGRRDAAKPEPD